VSWTILEHDALSRLIWPLSQTLDVGTHRLASLSVPGDPRFLVYDYQWVVNVEVVWAAALRH